MTKIGNVEFGDVPGWLSCNMAALHEFVNDVAANPGMRFFSGPASMMNIFMKMKKGSGKNLRFKIDEAACPRMVLSENWSRSCMVAFSGGRDSAAAAVLMEHSGYRVTLFHVSGINGLRKKIDTECVKNISASLKMPLKIVSIKTKNKKPFTEHPLKNQLIFSAMVEAGLKMGIHDFTDGHDQEGSGISSPWNDGYSDKAEVYEAADVFFKSYDNRYKRHTVIYHNTDAHFILKTLKPDIMKEISSCIELDEIRLKKNAANSDAFGFSLEKNRCGSCYKCAREYIIKVLDGSVKKNDAYFKRCIKVLESMLGWERRHAGSSEKIPKDFHELMKFFINERQVELFKKGKFVLAKVTS